MVYTPVSATFGSVTLHYNIDGVLHKLTGCRGTFSLNTAVGGIPTIDFTMTGIYNAPTDTAAPTVTYADQATPRIFKAGNSGAFTLLGYSGCLQSVSMDLGNTTVYRELVGCTKEVLITDRASTGTVVIEAPTIAQKDYFTAALTDGTLGELSFIHGTTGGNIVALQSTRVDIGDPQLQRPRRHSHAVAALHRHPKHSRQRRVPPRLRLSRAAAPLSRAAYQTRRLAPQLGGFLMRYAAYARLKLMSFVRKKVKTFKWPVTVEEPADGGVFDSSTFDITFKRLGRKEFATLSEKGDLILLKAVALAWDGIDDEDGKPVPFSL